MAISAAERYFPVGMAIQLAVDPKDPLEIAVPGANRFDNALALTCGVVAFAAGILALAL